MTNKSQAARTAETRSRILDATRGLVLRQGFTATGVDQICREAGLTKGAFFHHFKSKEALGLAALADWGDFGMALYAEATREPLVGPLDHVHRFFDIMMGFVQGSDGPVTCVVGIIAQELSLTHPSLREACAGHLEVWTDFAAQLLDEAKAAHTPAVDFDSRELTWFLNSLWQGSMLVSKARQEPEIIINNLQRARAYVGSLFA